MYKDIVPVIFDDIDVYLVHGVVRWVLTLNIIGNVFFIFTLSLGVAGAALSTLLSIIISALIILILLKQPKQDLYIDSYLSIRPEIETITKILKTGIQPALKMVCFNLENSSFNPLYPQWDQPPLPPKSWWPC